MPYENGEGDRLISKVGRALLILGITAFLFLGLTIRTAEAKNIQLDTKGRVTEQLYLKLKPQLDSIEAGDVLFIQIEGPGGSVYYGMKIIDAIQKSDTRKVCSVNGRAGSMSAYLISVCDKVYVNPNAQIMYHLPFQYGDNGEKLRPVEVLKVGLYLTKRFGVDIILPEHALKLYLQGQDVWINGKEFEKLYNNYLEVRNAR